MFGWLRDTLATTSPTRAYRHSMIPSPFLRQQQQQQQQQNPKHSLIMPPSDDDDDEGTDEESNDNSFYHNPYHSSGHMNYADTPQQQYVNEHNYPTFLARRQTADNTTNSSIDDQIYSKLISLQQRGSDVQSYAHRQYDYAYRNRIVPTSQLPFVVNGNRERDNLNDEPEEEIEIRKDDDDDDDDDGIRAYYPGQYPNSDEHFDLASVVLWYRNVMQSVKKFM